MSKTTNFVFSIAMLSLAASISAQTIEIKKQDYVEKINIPIERPKSNFGGVEKAAQPTVNLTSPTQVQLSSVMTPEWRITQNDATISNAVNRWATPSGYQIVWQAEKDLPSYIASYQGSFESALESLMTDTKHSGYPLHACLYDNKVVRVLHVTQSCGQ